MAKKSKGSKKSKSSTKKTDAKNVKADTLSVTKKYLYNNIALLLPIITFVIFNFFKENFFEGTTIKFIELFYMIIMTTVVFNYSLKNIDASCATYNNSLKYALVLVFIANLFTVINPCRQYMTFAQLNLFYMLLLVLGYNLLNYFIEKNKESYCKADDNKFVLLFLFVLHFGIIYIGK